MTTPKYRLLRREKQTVKERLCLPTLVEPQNDGHIFLPERKITFLLIQIKSYEAGEEQ